jgi:hypothetical protein
MFTPKLTLIVVSRNIFLKITQLYFLKPPKGWFSCSSLGAGHRRDRREDARAS